ncbi:DUF4381 domain-containing protein [Vibrio astriarenae]|uniref:DUF4381 domain-containing protein n=1 Tax=Vibrio astriarenae TaxID=1481923 RepID=UPI003734C183
MGFASTQHEVPTSYILRDLQDVVPVETVSWFPQTIGWKIVAIIIITWLLYLLFKRLNTWWHNRYRTEALSYLRAISIEFEQFEYETFRLIKIVLISRSNRYRVIHGREFISTLDETGQNLTLDQSVSTQWMDCLNKSELELSSEQRKELKAYLEQWLLRHVIPKQGEVE